MASRFWVGGTGTWDASDTTHWAATSGGAGGQSVPGSSDTVTFDANSGGGTVTLNFGGTITIQSLAMGAFTGTFENSVNNNNITMTASGGAFNISGTGTRTIKLGTATYTLSNNSVTFNAGTATNLTYTASSATIAFTGASGTRAILSSSGTALSHGNVTVAASSGAGRFQVNSNNAAQTLKSLTITAPNYIEFPPAGTTTITDAFNWAGSSSSQIAICSMTTTSSATVAATAGSVASWCSFRDMTFTGSPVASNSFNLGNNSGITINAPSGGGGAGAGFSATIF